MTNAQFPDQLRALGPVTQLYVSIDASTKDSLKKVDRPLFKDFWERFLACIDVLKEKVHYDNFFMKLSEFSPLLLPFSETTYRLQTHLGQGIQH